MSKEAILMEMISLFEESTRRFTLFKMIRNLFILMSLIMFALLIVLVLIFKGELLHYPQNIVFIVVFMGINMFSFINIYLYHQRLLHEERILASYSSKIFEYKECIVGNIKDEILNKLIKDRLALISLIPLNIYF